MAGRRGSVASLGSDARRAAGAGEQTIAAAKRAGPAGYVLATDISSNILQFAAAEAQNSRGAPLKFF